MTNRLVALDMPNSPEFVRELQRCWDDGDAAFPIDQRLPPAARHALFTEIRPALLRDSQGNESPLPDPLPTQPGDAVVVATSGTTGLPKGVVLSLDAVAASATITSQALGITSASDKWYACLPFAHIGGLSVLLRAMLTNTAVTATGDGSAAALRAASESGHTHVSLVVAMLERVHAPNWRTILLGGSRLPDDLAPNVVRTYGMTETGSGIVYDGFALPSVDLRTTDGRIELRSPTLARCYRTKDGERSLSITADGWYETGDAGSLRPDGLLQVSGRIGDVIVTGGEKVWPDSVEKAIATHPAVLEVGVCGVPDQRWGSAVCAVIVFAPDNLVTLDEIRAHTKLTLPAYSAPQHLLVVSTLPRTVGGKLRRTELATLATSTLASG